MLCGGVFGLWIGFGTLTFIEVAGLLVLMCLVCCQKMAGQEVMTSETRHRNVGATSSNHPAEHRLHL